MKAKLLTVILAVLLLTTIGCSESAVQETADSATASTAAEAVTDTGEAPTASETVDGSSSSLVLYSQPGATVPAYQEPSASSPVVAELKSRHGGPQAFLATMSFEDYSSATNPIEWVEVLLPTRPNGTLGWVSTADLDAYRNRYRLEINTTTYQLKAFEGDEVVVDTPVGLGVEDTPTPIGRFYINELIQAEDPAGAYGPYAFGLSGYSETLDSFGTGEGVIGIHGTNQPELIGTSVSHGCIRIDNITITQLAAVLPLGTPVEIHT